LENQFFLRLRIKPKQKHSTQFIQIMWRINSTLQKPLFPLLSRQSYRWLSSKVPITFVDKNGEKQTVQAETGTSLLEVAHANHIDLGGACEGSLACSTCHVILEPKVYESLAEPSDEENDMLDLAFGLTETSRLGCQIVVTEELAGMVVRLPAATRNISSGKLGK
jgi:ferredoxin